KAESLQVQPAAVFEALQSYLGSSFVNFFNSFNQVFQVYIQADTNYRLEPKDLRNMYVRNQSGGVVPLNKLLEVRPRPGAALPPRAPDGVALHTSWPAWPGCSGWRRGRAALPRRGSRR